MSAEVIRAYYEAFNAGDREDAGASSPDDVAHDINQGGREIGKDAFRRFLAHMDRCSRGAARHRRHGEPDGSRAAAEFTVHGTYLVTDEPAAGERPDLHRPGRHLLRARGGKIARVTTYYNLKDWIARVGG